MPPVSFYHGVREMRDGKHLWGHETSACPHQCWIKTGRSITFLSHFMHRPRVLCLQSKKIVNLGTSQNIFPSHLSFSFQRIIKTSNMMRWFPFLISEHLISRQLNLFWTVRCCPCFGSHVRHCHTYSHFCSAVNPSGVWEFHSRAPFAHTYFCHSWTFPFTSALLAHKRLSPREILPHALFSRIILIKYNQLCRCLNGFCPPKSWEHARLAGLMSY